MTPTEPITKPMQEVKYFTGPVPIRLGVHALAAHLINQEYYNIQYRQMKYKVDRNQCTKCLCKIGEGRAGRMCIKCRTAPQQDESVVPTPTE